MKMATGSASSHGEYAQSNILPTLCRGLVELCRARPEHPVAWLGHWLHANRPPPQVVSNGPGLVGNGPPAALGGREEVPPEDDDVGATAALSVVDDTTEHPLWANRSGEKINAHLTVDEVLGDSPVRLVCAHYLIAHAKAR